MSEKKWMQTFAIGKTRTKSGKIFERRALIAALHKNRKSQTKAHNESSARHENLQKQ
jgi:hypothetical protein